MNRKINELKYLKNNFNMESEAQIRDSPTRAEDTEMSQRSFQTQNREIPEQEWVRGEEEGDRPGQRYVISRKERGTRR
jgi:hypothetical protein